MENVLVSIIIPAYNAGATLEKCLNSLTNQTYDNYEIILVDNNSTDNTKKIIESFQAKYKNIKYFFEPQRSVGLARNLAINNASGSILCFTDSDCVVPPNWVFEMTKYIRSGQEKVVMGSEGDPVSNFWTKRIQNSDQEYNERITKDGYIYGLDGKNFSIDADLMKKIMFDPKIKMIDDIDLYVRLKKFSKVKFLEEVKVGHYHKSSLRKFARMIFTRGFWAVKIAKKYSKEDLKGVVFFESLSSKNYILFLPWLIFQIFKRDPGDFFYLAVSEICWRSGVIWSLIKNT